MLKQDMEDASAQLQDPKGFYAFPTAIAGSLFIVAAPSDAGKSALVDA
jgi:guanylate kinase